MELPGTIAVLDVGKTNAKISVAATGGRILDSATTANLSRPGPPWLHHDLAGLSEWVFATLAALCRDHPIAHVVPTGHGTGGVLIAHDPDLNGDGAALPMIDYEQPMPPAIDIAYAEQAGSFLDRGSAIMLGSTHSARQLFRMQAERPDDVARASAFLNVPQYWAWRLSGVPVSEVTAMGAQSHLWNVSARSWSGIVAAQGWARLMPPFARSWEVLGPVRPALVQRYGLPPGLQVLAGGHDSSLNFYRHAAGGLSGFSLASTGTWIVALSDRADPGALDEARGMTLNADVKGNPVGGALTMGGREFTHVSGDGWRRAGVDLASLRRLVAQGTHALPTFGESDGQFPRTAGQGRITGPAPADADDRRALAVLYTALLTWECAASLSGSGPLVLDGTFLNEPFYAPIVAALRPDWPTLVSAELNGVATGAALLVRHATRNSPAPAALVAAIPADIPGLAAYAADWRRLALSRP